MTGEHFFNEVQSPDHRWKLCCQRSDPRSRRTWERRIKWLNLVPLTRLKGSWQWVLCTLSRQNRRTVRWDPAGEVVHLLHLHLRTEWMYVLYYDNMDQDLNDLQQLPDIWIDENIMEQHLRHLRDCRLGMPSCRKYPEDKFGHHQLR